jgi:gp16 family phage-associated protein
MQRARTAEEARAWFEGTGQTVTQWAQDHGFSASVVYALLSGRTRGRRGDAHRAAIALGLKPKIASISARRERATPAIDHEQTPGDCAMT